MPSSLPNPVPLSAQSIPFWEFLENGTVPKEYLESDYITEQFVERLVHYVLTVPSKTFSMIQLSNLLEQIDPRHQVFFFKRLKETSPQSLKDFSPLYYGFMAEFESLLDCWPKLTGYVTSGDLGFEFEPNARFGGFNNIVDLGELT